MHVFTWIAACLQFWMCTFMLYDMNLVHARREGGRGRRVCCFVHVEGETLSYSLSYGQIYFAIPMTQIWAQIKEFEYTFCPFRKYIFTILPIFRLWSKLGQKTIEAMPSFEREVKFLFKYLMCVVICLLCWMGSILCFVWCHSLLWLLQLHRRPVCLVMTIGTDLDWPEVPREIIIKIKYFMKYFLQLCTSRPILKKCQNMISVFPHELSYSVVMLVNVKTNKIYTNWEWDNNKN